MLLLVLLSLSLSFFIAFWPFSLLTTLKRCFQLETYLSLKGSNEFGIKCRCRRHRRRHCHHHCRLCRLPSTAKQQQHSTLHSHTHTWLCHLESGWVYCSGDSDSGSNKKSNVVRSTWKCSFGASEHSEQEIKGNKMFWFHLRMFFCLSFCSFFNFFGVASRFKEEFRMFYWRIYFLILSDCQRYVKNALFKFLFSFCIFRLFWSLVLVRWVLCLPAHILYYTLAHAPIHQVETHPNTHSK